MSGRLAAADGHVLRLQFLSVQLDPAPNPSRLREAKVMVLEHFDEFFEVSGARLRCLPRCSPTRAVHRSCKPARKSWPSDIGRGLDRITRGEQR